MQWVLDELKRYNVVAADLRIDAHMIAIRSAKHVRIMNFMCITMFFLILFSFLIDI